MAASVDAAPIERDLADVAGAIVVHVELQNARLAAAHERSLKRDTVALPLGATLPTALPSSRAPELYERR